MIEAPRRSCRGAWHVLRGHVAALREPQTSRHQTASHDCSQLGSQPLRRPGLGRPRRRHHPEHGGNDLHCRQSNAGQPRIYGTLLGLRPGRQSWRQPAGVAGLAGHSGGCPLYPRRSQRAHGQRESNQAPKRRNGTVRGRPHVRRTRPREGVRRNPGDAAAVRRVSGRRRWLSPHRLRRRRGAFPSRPVYGSGYGVRRQHGSHRCPQRRSSLHGHLWLLPRNIGDLAVAVMDTDRRVAKGGDVPGCLQSYPDRDFRSPFSFPYCTSKRGPACL